MRFQWQEAFKISIISSCFFFFERGSPTIVRSLACWYTNDLMLSFQLFSMQNSFGIFPLVIKRQRLTFNCMHSFFKLLAEADKSTSLITKKKVKKGYGRISSPYNENNKKKAWLSFVWPQSQVWGMTEHFFRVHLESVWAADNRAKVCCSCCCCWYY